jgi:hypothetical protein
MPSRARPLIAMILALALLGYAGVGRGWADWWISGAAAPGIAWLLWSRHPRARFAAYLFFSAVALRGLAAGAWEGVLFAASAVVLLQLPSARRVWPRLRPGWRAARGDTMAGP